MVHELQWIAVVVLRNRERYQLEGCFSAQIRGLLPLDWPRDDPFQEMGLLGLAKNRRII
jgi:hypothetical protein